MSPAPPSTSSPINLLAIIPARKGSRRIPGKNGRPLGGKPLVLWTIDATIKRQLQDLARSVVSVSPAHPTHILWMCIERDTLDPFAGSWHKAGDRKGHKAYALNGVIFVTPRKVLDTGDLVGPRPRPYIMPREKSIDIDDELDWRIAEALVR